MLKKNKLLEIFISIDIYLYRKKERNKKNTKSLMSFRVLFHKKKIFKQTNLQIYIKLKNKF